MTVLEPAPEGFEFDPIDLVSEAVAALAEVSPELHAEVVANTLRWFAELDGDRIPVVILTGGDGLERGRLALDWHRVGGVPSQ